MTVEILREPIRWQFKTIANKKQSFGVPGFLLPKLFPCTIILFKCNCLGILVSPSFYFCQKSDNFLSVSNEEKNVQFTIYITASVIDGEGNRA